MAFLLLAGINIIPVPLPVAVWQEPAAGSPCLKKVSDADIRIPARSYPWETFFGWR
jgi:hypothetical protein